MLCGRDHERGEIDRLLSGARAGRSGVLVVRGEAGIGKSALLDYAAAAAETGVGMPVLRGVGIESEAELPFAGLHLLLNRSMDRLTALPRAQADALRAALGLGEQAGGDRFLVGSAVLSLLAELAGDGPLLCLVDDAQWMDRASADALLFAAHRLEAEGVVLVFAARDEGRAFRAPGLPELHLERLDDAAATDLLAAQAGQLTAEALRRVLAEAGGNPLALLELPAVLGAQSPTGDPGEAAVPAPRRMERVYRTMIDALPQPARELLLVAATDDSGDLGLVLRAGRAFGADVPDLATLEHADLVRLTPATIAFRHPLIRAAAYHGAPLTDRWSAHRALAAALVGDTDAHVERRAHHRAALATEPDETLARDLHGGAERAARRGALAAAVTGYERAAQLSPEPATAAQRWLLAAEAAAELGDHARAAELVERLVPDADPLLDARVATVRGHGSYALGRLPSAYRQLRAAVSLHCEHDPGLAVWLLMEMVFVTYGLGDRAVAAETATLLDALELPDRDPMWPVVRLLRRLVDMQLDKDPVPPPLPEVAAAALQVRAGGPRGRLFIVAACLAAGESAETYTILEELVAAMRSQGLIGLLPHALTQLGVRQLYRGRPHEAWATTTEAARIAKDIGDVEWLSQANGVLACLAGINGDEAACREYARAALGDGPGRSPSAGLVADWALGLLALGQGEADEALARLEAVGRETSSHFQPVVTRSAADLVEAAARAGQPERAGPAMARVERWADHAGQLWVDSLRLRCRALLASDDEAEPYYLAAIEAQEPDRPWEPARTRLLYGQWLRRARRRTDARRQLRAALDTFERIGARSWADRARTELRATGETVVSDEPASSLLDRLTSQELQVVRLAATGLSNRAIGGQLFLSPRTVGYHLYKAYPKLGVTARGELARLPL